MKRIEKALSAVKVRGPLPAGKHHDGGGLGLYLRVEANDSRFWVQRITIAGKRREMGLGSPPLITLAMAREKAIENKRMALAGTDPIAAKRRRVEVMTFARAVELYLSAKVDGFRSDKHRKQWRATLDTYAVPVIGAMPIDAIEPRDVLRILHPIWAEKTETASRLRGRIEAILSWATVAGHRAGDNPARWKGNLSELLPKPSKVADSGNHPALPLADLPRWWADLCKREGMAARALQFAVLTCARSGEIRGMTWAEVDFGNDAVGAPSRGPLWTIPAQRMKAEREHRVPLTAEAVALLQSLPRMAASPYVFFAPQGGMLSDMTISAVMRRMQEAEVKRLAEADRVAGRKPEDQPRGYVDERSGRPAVPHGMRSAFRDWAAEQGVDREMAEMALAHRVGSEVERAYRRTDMVERRRAMMEAWGRYVRGEGSQNVVQFAKVPA
jgi:integrase